MRNTLLAMTFLFAAPLAPGFAAEPADPEGIRFFEKHIRPILVESCYDCHSTDYAESELQLDSYKGILKGGKAGPAIVPGKPKQSLLLTAIGYQDKTLQMPPLEKLDETKVALLRKWVAMGAPYPGGTAPAPREPALDLTAARQYWAFQPIGEPPPPVVKRTAWTRGAIDQFILARLESEGFAPAPPADKRTLLRRATFDLTGLPPTVAQMRAFLADDSPNAFARVVDRLLASPAYGQRWGRHWLDVARYSDSNGLDENVAYGNAWRYRDYVVNAFNTDKAYDTFVVEQLAGDLLPFDSYRQRNEQRIATAFLTLGPKLLAEVDKKKLSMDIIDEQIDTTGRAFLGLTLGCARCHDHKFDPILTADYYAMAGIFKSTQTMDSLKTIAMWHENPIPTPADLDKKTAHEQKVAEQQARIDALVASANRALLATMEDGAKIPKKPETHYPKETRAKLKDWRGELAALKKNAPAMPMAMGVAEAKPVDVAIHVRGSHLTLGEVVPRRMPLVLVSTDQPTWPEDHSGRLAMARWIASPKNPLTARVMVNRIWHWHFGRGLVATPDNFGELGSRPSHPQLLDWLARRFIAGGWSIKALHREIMLSRTYQMSSRHNAQAAAADPENRLLWRFSLRRLEAEELRDALLAVSGRLDLAIEGTLLKTKNHAHVFNHTSMDHTTYNTTRRSLYLPIIRNNLYGPFQLFDYSDAGVVTGDRPTSTVAPQALFFLNSDLVAESAQAMAAGLAAENNLDDVQRLEQIYERALHRSPTAEDAKRALRYLERLEEAYSATEENPANSRTMAWTALCQMILSSNEFVTVR